MSILVITEHDNSALKPSVAQCVAAAGELTGEIHLLVAGSGCSEVVRSATEVENVAKVIHVDDVSLAQALAEDLAQAIVGLADHYDYILAAASTTGKNFIPRVAALLDVQAISDVSKVISADTFERPIYAGNVIATVQSLDAKKVMTIRTTAFDGVSLKGNSAPVESINAAPSLGLSEFIKEQLAESDRPELTAASVVVSGGRGLQNGENFELLYTLADKLNGAVGASRAAVDAGYVPNDMQVGQTGKIVAPELYIAVGISGAIQHLAGMKDSKTIVAINKDEDAPIFQVADYGLVADLFEAIPELNSRLGV